MNSYTTNTHMAIPGAAERQWDLPLNANFQYLDALSCIGGLAVAVAGDATTSLAVSISRGNYQGADGSVASFPGATSVPVSPSVTTRLWIGSGGQIGSGPSFPATSHLRLASVVADATHIVSVVDERVVLRLLGPTGTQGALSPSDPSAPSSSVIAVDPGAPGLGFFGVAPQPQSGRIPPLVPDGAAEPSPNTIKAAGNTFDPAVLDENFSAMMSTVNALIAALTKYGLLASGE